MLQWTQLSRANSLRRGYRPRKCILGIGFCFLISQIGSKNLENYLKVKFRKKKVKKVKKTCFSDILDFLPKIPKIMQNTGFWQNSQFLVKSKYVNVHDASAIGTSKFTVQTPKLKQNFTSDWILHSLSRFFQKWLIVQAYKAE